MKEDEVGGHGGWERCLEASRGEVRGEEEIGKT
jgi:hypothetical protein